MLNYKASNIAKAERLHGANFFKTLEGFGEQTPSLADIIFVLEAGGLTEDEAGDLVDEKGIVKSIQMAVEGLTDSGFLGNSKEVQEAKKTAKELLETSRSTGEETKA
jgi:hypothetical protein